MARDGRVPALIAQEGKAEFVGREALGTRRRAIDLGKPAPLTDDVIRLDFSSKLQAWPLPNVDSEARVTTKAVSVDVSSHQELALIVADSGNGISKIRFHRNGTCSRFGADIGVDDEKGTKGSVVFQVWTDGTKRFDSRVMTGTTATKAVDVDVSNRGELRLTVADGRDGIGSDRGDWAGARITCSY